MKKLAVVIFSSLFLSACDLNENCANCQANDLWMAMLSDKAAAEKCQIRRGDDGYVIMWGKCDTPTKAEPAQQ